MSANRSPFRKTARWCPARCQGTASGGQAGSQGAATGEVGGTCFTRARGQAGRWGSGRRARAGAADRGGPRPGRRCAGSSLGIELRGRRGCAAGKQGRQEARQCGSRPASSRRHPGAAPSVGSVGGARRWGRGSVRGPGLPVGRGGAQSVSQARNRRLLSPGWRFAKQSHPAPQRPDRRGSARQRGLARPRAASPARPRRHPAPVPALPRGGRAAGGSFAIADKQTPVVHRLEKVGGK